MLKSLLLFLSLVITTGCTPYLVVNRGAVHWDKLQEIKRGVVALRGLDFKAEVPVEIKNRHEMRSTFESELERDYGEERLKNMALAYAQLGLFPKGLDLKKSLLDFYTGQVAAFYDPRAKKLVLPEDLGGGILVGALQFLAQRDILGEMVLAHELTHALQDQHFSLGERISPSSNDDKTLALRAVVEGDATLSGFGYVFGAIDEGILANVNQSIQGSMGETRSSLSNIPEAIMEELLFQYYGGVSFVSYLLEKRGWLGVNRIYSYPPLSTEQVLHPEKYFVLPDPPTRINITDLSSLFPSEGKEIENNVLGELMIRVLFRQFLSEEEAKLVAHGWDGDRFIAFRRDGEISFIWATVWDSSKDAEEFLHGYREILPKKYADAGTGSPRAYIEQRDNRVVVVEGLEIGRVKERIEKIWQGMELKEEPFKRPFPSF